MSVSVCATNKGVNGCAMYAKELRLWTQKSASSLQTQVPAHTHARMVGECKHKSLCKYTTFKRSEHFSRSLTFSSASCWIDAFSFSGKMMKWEHMRDKTLRTFSLNSKMYSSDLVVDARACRHFRARMDDRLRLKALTVWHNGAACRMCRSLFVGSVCALNWSHYFAVFYANEWKRNNFDDTFFVAVKFILWFSFFFSTEIFIYFLTRIRSKISGWPIRWRQKCELGNRPRLDLQKWALRCFYFLSVWRDVETDAIIYSK